VDRPILNETFVDARLTVILHWFSIILHGLVMLPPSGDTTTLLLHAISLILLMLHLLSFLLSHCLIVTLFMISKICCKVGT